MAAAETAVVFKDEGATTLRVVADGDGGGEIVLPDIRLGAVETVGEPVGGDETFDEEALLGGLGAEAGGVLDGEGFELVYGLVGEDEGLGSDAEFEGVEAGDGFPLRGAGAGGL